jgi:Ca-activated chloride channel family protein
MELLPALELAFNQPAHTSLARQIVVLTDGEISNTDATLALCRTHAPRARVFTFGIGAGASHHLVKGLARAGGGAAEFIYPGERIEPKVVRLFGRLLSPALTNVRVDWGGLDVRQAPSTEPVLFSGGRLLLYGSVRTTPVEWTKTVRISADARRPGDLRERDRSIQDRLRPYRGNPRRSGADTGTGRKSGVDGGARIASA